MGISADEQDSELEKPPELGRSVSLGRESKKKVLNNPQITSLLVLPSHTHSHIIPPSPPSPLFTAPLLITTAISHCYSTHELSCSTNLLSYAQRHTERRHFKRAGGGSVSRVVWLPSTIIFRSRWTAGC